MYNVINNGVIIIVLTDETTYAGFFNWIGTRGRLTKLSHTLFASIQTSTLGAVVILTPRLVVFVEEPARSCVTTTTLARAHRTALGLQRLFHLAVELGALVTLARDHARVARATRAHVRTPLRILRVAFAIVIARQIRRTYLIII